MTTESAEVVADSDPPETLQSLIEKASNLGVELEPWFETLNEVAKIGVLKSEIQIEELQAEKIARRSQIEELKELRALQAEAYKGSLDEMLAKFGGGIPDIGLPPHQPSVPGANFTIRKSFVTAEDLNFQIRTKHGRKHIRSFLDYHHLDKNSQGLPVLSYQNEATVAEYVDGVVKMCLKTLGYFDNTRVFTEEMTLFSLRPDLIVVEHTTRGIILVIEVKMPGQELFSSPKIAEQVVNYLMLQYRLGNTVPFVLLSSYREACLCCLKPSSLLVGANDDTEQMDVEEGQPDEPSEAARGAIGTAKEIVSEAAGKLKSRSVDLSSSIGGEADDENTQKPPTKPGFGAPDKIPASLTTAIPRKRKARNVNKPNITLNRKPEAIYSEKFRLNNMMQGVSLALTCGVLSQEQKTTKAPELWPEQGSLLDGWHPCVENESYKWAFVEHLTINYEEQPLATKQNTEKYLLLRETGHGQNGRVSLAVDWEGRACALKFYLYSADAEAEWAFSPTKLEEMREKELELHKEAADREVQRWKTLQKQHAGIVIALELNKQHVVRMPLCCPVPEESRQDVLGDVKTKLQEFYDKGFMYREVRWQHVGCRKTVDPSHSSHPWEIIMLGMESLVEKGDESQNVIERQIEELRVRAGNAAASGPVGRLGL